MKRLISIFSLVLILTVSCEDYLETEQLTSVTSSNYFSTPDQAMSALVGCYDGLQRVWQWGIALPVATTIMGDLTFASTGASDADNFPMIDEFDLTRSPGNINLYEENWKDYYVAIFRCNTLLLNLDNVEWDGQESLRNSIEAEAKFLRAYLYFDMVRMFERIPLLTEPSNENIPQSDPDDTYSLIADDLLFAIENASDVPYSGISGTGHGRAHKWAAEALLARVYLYYTGYYGQSDLLGKVSQSDALGYVEDVIANGGFGLVENFSDLWPAAATYAAVQRGDSLGASTYVGENNKEVIFAIKYTYTSNWDGNSDGNHWMVMNGLRNQSWGQYGYGNGWGASSVLPSLYENWDPNDERRSASIMAIEEEGIDFKQINDVKEYTGYFTKKYTPTADAEGRSIAEEQYGGVVFMISQFQDYFSIRYSDVLLMAAELGSANALDYLHQVQDRSGATRATEVTKDIIFEERKLELAFEGHRYWDLLRYDNTLQYAADMVSFDGTVKNGGVDVPKVIDGENLKKTKGLFQIPNNQITLSNNVLTQNPGWE